MLVAGDALQPGAICTTRAGGFIPARGVHLCARFRKNAAPSAPRRRCSYRYRLAARRDGRHRVLFGNLPCCRAVLGRRSFRGAAECDLETSGRDADHGGDIRLRGSWELIPPLRLEV